jgi:glycosyltransferase involved in cell wall biosynthesis
LEREIRQGNEKYNQDTSNRANIKVEVIIPTLNEERTIAELIRNILSCVLPVKLSIFVIDGSSTDGTLDILKRENIKFMIQRGRGKGSAMREAVDQSTADIVVFMDGDGTYSSSDLKLLLEPLLNDKADMAVGSRLLGKRERGAVPKFNTLGNHLFNRAINFAMKSSITDSLSGYRALYRKTFNDLMLFSNSFEIEVEITVEALAKGYRVFEVPISYGLRKGQSSAKLDPIGDGIKIAKTLFFILVNINPLKFFGLISLVFFVAGIYPASEVLYEKIFTGEIVHIPSAIFSSLLFVTGTISIVVGIVSELVVRSRRRIEYLINKKFERS